MWKVTRAAREAEKGEREADRVEQRLREEAERQARSEASLLEHKRTQELFELLKGLATRAGEGDVLKSIHEEISVAIGKLTNLASRRASDESAHQLREAVESLTALVHQLRDYSIRAGVAGEASAKLIGDLYAAERGVGLMNRIGDKIGGMVEEFRRETEAQRGESP